MSYIGTWRILVTKMGPEVWESRPKEGNVGLSSKTSGPFFNPFVFRDL